MTATKGQMTSVARQKVPVGAVATSVSLPQQESPTAITVCTCGGLSLSGISESKAARHVKPQTMTSSVFIDRRNGVRGKIAPTKDKCCTVGRD